MHSHVKKSRGNEHEHTAPSQFFLREDSSPAFQFKDNREEIIAQRKLQTVMQNGSKQAQNIQFQALANQYSASQPQPVQKKENNTGLPNNLKSGVENLSGLSMDDVKVHYNSSKPAQMQAHAYAQGSNIHVAPGQEQHLAHEAWHVVQQKQGRVKPTAQLHGGVNINDDKGLEREADVMGSKSLQRQPVQQQKKVGSVKSGPIQAKGLGPLVMQMKKPSRFTIVTLAIEGSLQIGIGIVGVLAGAGAITSAVLAPAGVIPIIGGVGQIIIGASKIIRSVALGISRYNEDGPGPKAKILLGFLTGLEASVAVATGIAGLGGAIAAHGIALIISKVISIISSLVKYIRALFNLNPKPSKTVQKASRWTVILESIGSALAAIAEFIGEPGKFVASAVTYLVNLVKEMRGGHGVVAAEKQQENTAANTEVASPTTSDSDR
ncbi:MAG: DUF4157 domain-containing protein [Lewinella sp.]|uniref:eCIS core domain-containing protein n=1 Tax=Lewinella sp. TaxID=2004506 RepID=UPI003D6BE7F7